MKVIEALLVALIVIRSGNGSGPLVQEALARVFAPWSQFANLRIIQLLNQLCNESQLNDEVRRDACYGCFFRASSQPTGYPMLLNMASCADTYLNNTSYGHCQTYLKNATSSASAITNTGIVYCSFIECIRQVNKEILIERCVVEVVETFPTKFNCSNDQLAKFFVNTAACFLAKTRCGYPNPVTGAAQDTESLHGKIGNFLAVNALQVNTDFDVNIVKLPFVNSVKNDECGQFRNLKQADWPSVEC